MKKTVKLVILFAAKTLGIFALFRWITRSHVRLLCYHGGCIDDEKKFNPLLFSSPENLKIRMQWLQQCGFNFVTLDNAVKHLAGDGPTLGLHTVITFDDGWYSTSANLVPVLAELGIPSTLYLCTEHYREGWPVAAVTVRYILWKTRQRQVALTGFGSLVDGQYDLADPGATRRLELAARDMISNYSKRNNDYDMACEILERFALAFGVTPEELKLRSRRFQYMDKRELRNLPSQGCQVELHGHVHRYPIGDPVAFKADLNLCREAIMNDGLPEPRHYCYPSGDFDQDAGDLLRELGVLSGTTCLPGTIAIPSVLGSYFLPRFLDGEAIHMLEFQSEMSGFSGFLRSAFAKANHLISGLKP